MAAEFNGAGVVGVVEDTAGAMSGARNALRGERVGWIVADAEALVTAGVCVTKDARQKAHCGIDDDGCGQLAAREDVVADRELLVCEEFADTFVHTLVAAADEDDSLESCEVVRGGLCEWLALR